VTSELVNDAEYVGEVAVEFDRPGERAFVHPKIPSSEEPELGEEAPPLYSVKKSSESI